MTLAILGRRFVTSKVLYKNLQNDDFITEAIYFGVSFNSSHPKKDGYTDIEKFILKATCNLLNSRITEGVLCWLQAYGHLLNPSKVRRLISNGVEYDPSVLGAITEFLISQCNNGHQFKILLPFAIKLKTQTFLYSSPKITTPNTYFKKYNLIAHNYKTDHNKFLVPKKHIYRICIELKNRALFGSTVNADVASYLSYHPDATAYKTAKETFHHKASVFKIFADIQEAA